MEGELVNDKANDDACSQEGELFEGHVADEAELVRGDVLGDRMLLHGIGLVYANVAFDSGVWRSDSRCSAAFPSLGSGWHPLRSCSLAPARLISHACATCLIISIY